MLILLLDDSVLLKYVYIISLLVVGVLTGAPQGVPQQNKGMQQ